MKRILRYAQEKTMIMTAILANEIQNIDPEHSKNRRSKIYKEKRIRTCFKYGLKSFVYSRSSRQLDSEF